MTKPRYLPGCSAWSQVLGDAAAGLSASAWNVNANNGNVNNNHRNNNGFALAVRRAGEFQDDDLSYEVLYRAWRRARRQKVPSFNQLAFDLTWSTGLLQLQAEILERRWKPRPSTCFIATRPKAREIHAPDFADRIVHHCVIPRLEAIYKPVFIFDSYANRRGKGSHAAVRRLRDFVRQQFSGAGDGWCLKLDVANFFNRIHRPTLREQIDRRLRRADVPAWIQYIIEALLAGQPLDAGVRVRTTPDELALVPYHKRLANAPRDCGLPIGCLPSQFFANTYLNELDQFVKHRIGARRYLRYVDDFVIVHESRQQLVAWRDEIAAFLRDRLRLELRTETCLRPLRDGIDFLGYVIFPTHIRVRRRVVTHACTTFSAWECGHVRNGIIRTNPADYRVAQAVIASYEGHFAHASSWRLKRSIDLRFPWLSAVRVKRRFTLRQEHRHFALKLKT
jgi:retron-type reverse transcriptase